MNVSGSIIHTHIVPDDCVQSVISPLFGCNMCVNTNRNLSIKKNLRQNR